MRYPDYLVHYNKNHDKRTGRFTFGDGNGDGVSPDDYRTPELDKKYSELEKTGVFNLYYNKPWLKPEDNAEEKWGKDVVKAVDTGIKAFGAEKMWGSEDIDKNALRSWFLLEDQALGFPEIAYLLVKGWSGDKVFNALRDTDKMWEKDNAFRNAYTGYPNNKNWYKLSGEAANKEPYKDIYTLMEVSRNITDENDIIDTYIAKCEKLLKETKHSDMDYSSYLVHFNTRHDPKTGRFDFSLPNEKMKPYGGDKKSEFAKSLKTTYKSEGNSNLKSSRLTKYAIKSNKNETQQYNNNLRAFDLHKKKALKAYEKQDQKKYDSEITKMLSAYRYAKIHEIASNDSIELGKMLYKSVAKELADSFVFGGAIGGAIKGGLDAVDDNNKLVKYYKDTNKKVKAQMNMDYITKHPKEALEKLQIDTELDKRFGY